MVTRQTTPRLASVSLALLVALLCCSNILAGCSWEKPKKKLETLEFVVNDSLVGGQTVDSLLGVSYRVPKGWIVTPESMLDSALASSGMGRAGRTARTLTVRAAYIDTASGSLFVGLRSDSLLREDPDLVVSRVVQYHQARDSSAQIRSAAFRHNVFRIYQVMVVGGEVVQLTMMFDAENPAVLPFEWHFVVPKRFYREKARTIESMGGTLQTLTPSTTKKETPT